MQIQKALLVLLVLGGGFQAALAASGTASWLIVVESTPSDLFERGHILEGEKSLQLVTGQSVKLIASDGTVFTLTWHESGVPTRQIDDREYIRFKKSATITRRD